MYQVKLFNNVEQCNNWLKEQDTKIKVINTSLGIDGWSGFSVPNRVLVTYEIQNRESEK